MRLITATLLFCVVAFAQGDPNSYCDGGNQVLGDANLGSVTLDGIQETGNCPGEIGIVKSKTQTTTLAPGSEYTLTMQVSSCVGSSEAQTAYARVAKVWCDFNGNGVYDVPDEILGKESVGDTPVTTEVSITFKVPADATLGSTGLRVAVREGADVEPCQIFTYGGVKEFQVTIGGGLSLGSIICIIILVGIILYLAVGFGLYKKAGGTGVSAAIIPNLDFWKALPGLVKDGVEFTVMKIKGLMGGRVGAGSSYENIDDTSESVL